MIDLVNAYKCAASEVESGYGYEHSSLTNDDVVELVGLLRQAEKDAARYRWLRCCETEVSKRFIDNGHIVGFGVIDSLIDEAMRAS